MVNRNDINARASGSVDLDGGLVKGGGNGVDRNGVVGVGGVSRNVDNDLQLSISLIQSFKVGEGRNGLRQVNAVDKDVGVSNLLEGTTLGGLSHIPLDDVLLGQTNLSQQVNGTGTTSAKSTNDKNLRKSLASSDSRLEVLLDGIDEQVLASVVLNGGEVLVVAVSLSESPVLDTKSSTSKTGVETKSSNSSAIVILKELKIVEGTVASRESAENVLPAALVLVAVSKLNVLVDKREGLLGKLLKTNNEAVLGGLGPGALLDKSGTNVGKLLVLKDSKLGLFNKDLKASVQKLLGCGGGQGRSVLKGLGFSAEMENNGSSHC